MFAHDKSRKAQENFPDTYRDGVVRGYQMGTGDFADPRRRHWKHLSRILSNHAERYHRSARWHCAYSRGFVDGFFLARLNRR